MEKSGSIYSYTYRYLLILQTNGGGGATKRAIKGGSKQGGKTGTKEGKISILISKLAVYGIGGASIEWLKSYLSERNQKCFLNGSLSNNCVLSCGIPQGTILEPLLFLLYIKDLPNCLSHSQPRMYADDTHLTLAGNSADSIELNLNKDLASISKWLLANKLLYTK